MNATLARGMVGGETRSGQPGFHATGPAAIARPRGGIGLVHRQEVMPPLTRDRIGTFENFSQRCGAHSSDILPANSPANVAPEQLRTPLTTVRSGYGWAEFIDHAPCRTANDAQTFVRRAGAWLCLLHLFRATDMHEENVIGSGPG